MYLYLYGDADGGKLEVRIELKHSIAFAVVKEYYFDRGRYSFMCRLDL